MTRDVFLKRYIFIAVLIVIVNIISIGLTNIAKNMPASVFDNIVNALKQPLANCK
jgi:hypothetical protein